jgi:hypothetical protein
MQSNPHFFLGLLADADAWMDRRKSFLMDASSFRVGTCLNSFFLPFSIRGVL